MRRDPENESQPEGGSFWHWPAGLLDLFEHAEDRAYGGLLQALARRLAAEEATTKEMDATARRPMADIRESASATEADIRQDARRRVDVFRTALEDAHARSGGDPAREVPFDGADPQQDAFADVLIQYVVRTEYGTVRTDEPSPGRYVYSITCDWKALRLLAEEAGHALPLTG
jgi:hypothetical protein